MAGKAKPGGRKKHSPILPPPREENRKILTRNEASKPDLNPKIGQAVLRVVTEGAFTHFYLACGHLISVSKGDLKGATPVQMECWACAQENESPASVLIQR